MPPKKRGKQCHNVYSYMLDAATPEKDAEAERSDCANDYDICTKSGGGSSAWVIKCFECET